MPSALVGATLESTFKSSTTTLHTAPSTLPPPHSPLHTPPATSFHLPLQCREAVWMPSALVEATLADSYCPNCRPGPLSCLNLRFRRSEIPPQFDPVQQAVCIICNPDFKDLLEACGSSRPSIASHPRPPAPPPSHAPPFAGARPSSAPPFRIPPTTSASTPPPRTARGSGRASGAGSGRGTQGRGAAAGGTTRSGRSNAQGQQSGGKGRHGSVGPQRGGGGRGRGGGGGRSSSRAGQGGGRRVVGATGESMGFVRSSEVTQGAGVGDGGGRGGDAGCYTCGDPFHWSHECPLNQ
ncbi:unnamed protein product [Closterium sp. NIES-53]